MDTRALFTGSESSSLILDLPSDNTAAVGLEHDMAGVLVVTDGNGARNARETGLAIGLRWIPGLGDPQGVFSSLAHHERKSAILFRDLLQLLNSRRSRC